VERNKLSVKEETMTKTFTIVLTFFVSLVLAGCDSSTPPTGSGTGGVGSSGTGSGYGGGSTTSYGKIKITNSSSSTSYIYYVYISPSNASSWGPDQLGSNTIAPGASHTWRTLPNKCDMNYDLKVKFRDGTVKYAYEQYIPCGVTSSFRVNNY
jgi:hypothetical protein